MSKRYFVNSNRLFDFVSIRKGLAIIIADYEYFDFEESTLKTLWNRYLFAKEKGINTQGNFVIEFKFSRDIKEWRGDYLQEVITASDYDDFKNQLKEKIEIKYL